MPGGYDLDTLPIRVHVCDGESAVSWLRRLSVRYDTPVRDLLKPAGARRAVTQTSRVTGRLRNYPEIPQRLGLPPDQVRLLVNPKPLPAVTATYIDTFHRGEALVRAQSRYCPHCLTEPDPFWPDHWQSPLSLICLTHCCYLLRSCPTCHQPPQGTPAWLTRPSSCIAARPADPGPSTVRYGGSCRGATPTSPPAPPSPHPTSRSEPSSCCTTGPAAPPNPPPPVGCRSRTRSDFKPSPSSPTPPSAKAPGSSTWPPTRPGSALSAALEVLDQPDLDSAHQTAAWMLSYDGTHAPITPLARIQSHHYSPLLAAIQLHGVRGQLPANHQLTFRTGHPAPRYPVVTTPKNRRRLRSDHRPHLPEPEPAWIPQTLWWNTIPAALTDCLHPAVRGTALAMALARLGTTRDWTDICTDLHLPPSHANRIDGLTQHSRRTATWPALLTALEQLMTGLQQHPPPVDYQDRWTLGDDMHLITDAVLVGRLRHPSPVPVQTLICQFWERFTGGDIAYAPRRSGSTRPHPPTPHSGDKAASPTPTCSTSRTGTSPELQRSKVR